MYIIEKCPEVLFYVEQFLLVAMPFFRILQSSILASECPISLNMGFKMT